MIFYREILIHFIVLYVRLVDLDIFERDMAAPGGYSRESQQKPTIDREYAGQEHSNGREYPSESPQGAGSLVDIRDFLYTKFQKACNGIDNVPASTTAIDCAGLVTAAGIPG